MKQLHSPCWVFLALLLCQWMGGGAMAQTVTLTPPDLWVIPNSMTVSFSAPMALQPSYSFTFSSATAQIFQYNQDKIALSLSTQPGCSIKSATTDSGPTLTVVLGNGCNIATDDAVKMVITTGLANNTYSNGNMKYSMTFSGSQAGPSSTLQYVYTTFTPEVTLEEGAIIYAEASVATLFKASQSSVTVLLNGGTCSCTASTDAQRTLAITLGSKCTLLANYPVAVNVTSGIDSASGEIRITFRYSAVTKSKTSGLTKCQKAQQAATPTGSPPLVGGYVPQCNDDGSWAFLQVWPSTGYKWCVDSNGKEIAGTKVGPTEPTPNCDGSSESKSNKSATHSCSSSSSWSSFSASGYAAFSFTIIKQLTTSDKIYVKSESSEGGAALQSNKNNVAVLINGGACKCLASTGGDGKLTITLGSGCTLAAYSTVAVNITSNLKADALDADSITWTVTYGANSLIVTGGQASPCSTAPVPSKSKVALIFTLKSALSKGDTFTITSASKALLADQPCVAVDIHPDHKKCQYVASTATDRTLTISVQGKGCKLDSGDQITVSILSGLDDSIAPTDGIIWVVNYASYSASIGDSATTTTSRNANGGGKSEVVLHFALNTDLTKDSTLIVASSPNALVGGKSSVDVDMDTDDRSHCQFKGSTSPGGNLSIALRGNDCKLRASHDLALTISSALDASVLAKGGITWTLYYGSYIVTITGSSRTTRMTSSLPLPSSPSSSKATLSLVLSADLDAGDTIRLTSATKVLLHNKDTRKNVDVDIDSINSKDCDYKGTISDDNKLTIKVQNAKGKKCKLHAGENITIVISSGLDSTVLATGNLGWTAKYRMCTATFNGASPSTSSSKVILSFPLAKALKGGSAFTVTSSPNVILAKQKDVYVDIDSQHHNDCSYKPSISSKNVLTIKVKGCKCKLNANETVTIKIYSGVDFDALSSRITWTVKYNSYFVTISGGTSVTSGLNKDWDFHGVITSSTSSGSDDDRSKHDSDSHGQEATVDKPFRCGSQHTGASLSYASVRFNLAYEWTVGGTIVLKAKPASIFKANQNTVNVSCTIDSIVCGCTASIDDKRVMTVQFSQECTADVGSAVAITFWTGLQQNPSTREEVAITILQSGTVISTLSYMATNDERREYFAQFSKEENKGHACTRTPVVPSTVVGDRKLTSMSVYFTSTSTLTAGSSISIVSEPTTVFKEFTGSATVTISNTNTGTKTYVADASSVAEGEVTVEVPADITESDEVTVTLDSDEGTYMGTTPGPNEVVNLDVNSDNDTTISQSGFETWTQCDTVSTQYPEYQRIQPGTKSKCTPSEVLQGLDDYNCQVVVEECNSMVCTVPMPRGVIEGIKQRCIGTE